MPLQNALGAGEDLSRANSLTVETESTGWELSCFARVGVDDLRVFFLD